MSDLRRAAVAGMFYPESPAGLAAEVRAHLARSGVRAGPGVAPPKALIVPHAGYMYSGSIAASAYARLAAGRTSIRRVVLFGPGPSMRAMIESAPARRYEMSCGKSCALFSNATDSAVVTIVLKSASFWPDGIAVYTTVSPRRLMRSCSNSRVAPLVTVRLEPSMVPPIGGIHISITTRLGARCSQHPASQARRSTALTCWAEAGAARARAKAAEQSRRSCT